MSENTISRRIAVPEAIRTYIRNKKYNTPEKTIINDIRISLAVEGERRWKEYGALGVRKYPKAKNDLVHIPADFYGRMADVIQNLYSENSNYIKIDTDQRVGINDLFVMYLEMGINAENEKK